MQVLEGEGIQPGLFDADLEATMIEIEGWKARGIELVTVLDRRYPENLLADSCSPCKTSSHQPFRQTAPLG